MDKKEYEENLIQQVISSIERHGGKDCLSSIILTGSFGRGEPTYSTDANGNIHLKSDVEIALIFPDSGKKQSVEKLIENVSSEFEEDLNLMAVNEKRVRKVYNFNFSLRVPKYKTIFTYDLFNGSRTIWGRDYISEKKINLSEVDQYEAKRLVANRIGELIYLQDTISENEREYSRKQWKGKLMLAIGSAWLICEGKYVSSYHGQYDALEKSHAKADEYIGAGFFEEYNKVFHFLRDDGEEYEVGEELLREFVKKMDKYFRTKKIRMPRVNSASRVIKYSLKYMKTGCKYGAFGFEDGILQALIVGYWKQEAGLRATADVWHRVLY